jgi:iron complex outermembrane recepter protein
MRMPMYLYVRCIKNSIGPTAIGLVMCSGIYGFARASDNSGSSPTNGLEEIVVTASKREETLQNVPASVTALGSGQIQNLGIQSFQDYVDLVPGLSQRDNGAPGFGTIILRGLNTGPNQTTNTSAFYLDDIPFGASGFFGNGSAITPDPDLSDVDRIEVLKGPQGTLYGANSLGGLIRIVSKKPSLSDFSADVGLEGSSIDGGGSGGSVRASLDAPLVQDMLGVRLSAFDRRMPGYTDNVGTGTHNVNDSTSRGGKLSVLAKPASNVAIEVNALYQNLDSTGGAWQYDRTGTLIPQYGERQYSNYFNAESSTQYRAISAKVTYDTDFGSLIATGSYVNIEASQYQDYTATYGPLFTGIFPPTVIAGIKTFTTAPDLGKSTGELRFVSKREGPIELIAGLFYTKEVSDQPYGIYADNLATGVPLQDPYHVLLDNPSFDEYREYAGYTDLTYYITDQIDLTAGLRRSRNEESITSIGTGLLYPPTMPYYAAGSFSDDSTNYLATLRWRPTDTLSAYLRAASGYRPGGPQIGAQLPPGAQSFVKPDTVWDYEAGLKGTYFGGLLSADVSVYQINWHDVQLNSTFGGITFQGNGGSAKVDGVEFALQARPVDHMNIGLSGAYTNARISAISAGTSASIGAVAGDPLPLTARVTGAFTGDYVFSAVGGFEPSVGTTVAYRGLTHSSYPGALLNPDIEIPSYTTVDLRSAIKYKNYVLRFRVDNLLNKDGISSVITNNEYPGQPVPTIASIIMPRTFILGVEAHY